MHNTENVTKAGPSGDSQHKNSGFTDGLRAGQGEGGRGRRDCKAQAHTHKSLRSVLSLFSPPHAVCASSFSRAG